MFLFGGVGGDSKTSSEEISSPVDVLKLPGQLVGTVLEGVVEKPLNLIADVISDGEDHNVDNVVEGVLEKPVDAVADVITPESTNPQKLVCTNIWELLPVLIINVYLIIRNLIRTVLRFVLNLLFTVLEILESLLGLNGLLTKPIRSSVVAQIVWKSIQNSDLIVIADLNPLNAITDVLNPANLSLTSNAQFMLQVQVFFQDVLNKLITLFYRTINFVYWQILVLKELVSYPYKSFKTAFQKG